MPSAVRAQDTVQVSHVWDRDSMTGQGSSLVGNSNQELEPGSKARYPEVEYEHLNNWSEHSLPFID